MKVPRQTEGENSPVGKNNITGHHTDREVLRLTRWNVVNPLLENVFSGLGPSSEPGAYKGV